MACTQSAAAARGTDLHAYRERGAGPPAVSRDGTVRAELLYLVRLGPCDNALMKCRWRFLMHHVGHNVFRPIHGRPTPPNTLPTTHASCRTRPLLITISRCAFMWAITSWVPWT